ncbi:hypothetical protein GW17_00039758 [Ensete ventricosum]|nr:hypothetical protein GW17_00039758 [Ensete ventricosum]
MDSIIVASPTAAESSLHFGPLAGPGFYSMLKESVDRFLVEVQRETCDFAAFRSIFFRLLQSSVDPPLEVIWFYSALGYHEAIRLKRDALDRVSAVRDLLQLLSACSASCDGPKSVALLAPVVSELYHCVKEEKKMSGKVAKKLRKEIEGLAEALVSYISICSGQSSDGKELSYGYLQPCFVDVIRVWTVQHLGRGDGLSVLFPLVTDEIRVCFEQERCGIDYLAGVVVVEALLLSLSLKVQMDGSPRLDSQKELRLWAVSSISVFQNCVSFGRSSLPMTEFTDLLITEAAVEPTDANYDHFGEYILIRDLYIELQCRDKGDHSKAISYTNAFSTSCVPGSLIKWANYQVGLGKLNRPNATTPQALLSNYLLLAEWLMVLEEQGLKLFDDNISELHSKLAIKEYNGMPETTKFDSGSNSTDGDTFFFDSTGNVDENAADDDRDMEITDAAFLSAARSMKSEASKGRRKRKEWGYKGDESQVKFVKYKIHDNSVKEHLNTQAADRMSSDSETENPPSPDEMEE